MRGVNVAMAIMAAGTLALGAGMTSASAGSQVSHGSMAAAPEPARPMQLDSVTGEVTVVDPGAKTLVVRGRDDTEKELTLRADITRDTTIRQGMLQKTLADIQQGNHVWMTYEGTQDKWVADDIRILEPPVQVKGTEGPDIRTS